MDSNFKTTITKAYFPKKHVITNNLSDTTQISSNLLEISKCYHKRKIICVSIIAITLPNFTGTANAALVSGCTGVSLPPSVITNIVGQAVSPIASALDTTISSLLFPILGLNTNLNKTLNSIASGAQITLNVLDTSGNVVSPNAPCQTTSDSYTLNYSKRYFNRW